MARYKSPTTRPELLAAVRQHLLYLADGNKVKAEELLAECAEFGEMYDPLLRRFCHRIRLSQKETDDLLQDVWMKVWKAMERFEYDPERRGFRAWLATIVKNEAIDLARKLKRQKELSLSGKSRAHRKQEDKNAEDLSEAFEREEANAQLRAVTECMQHESPPKELEIFQRYFIDGQSGVDIAADLGVTDEAVRSAAYRARKRLRRIARRMSFSDPNLDT